jgi:small subunit ribosomal protein S16
MSVKIRLARIGKKHVPFYRLVAIDSRQKRDGQYLSNLGTYDAINGNIVQFDEAGFNEWVSKGAVVTDAAKKLLKKYKKSQKADAGTQEAPKAKKAKKAPVKAAQAVEASSVQDSIQAEQA